MIEAFLPGLENAEKIEPWEIYEVRAAAEGEAVGTILLIGDESHAVFMVLRRQSRAFGG